MYCMNVSHAIQDDIKHFQQADSEHYFDYMNWQLKICIWGLYMYFSSWLPKGDVTTFLTLNPVSWRNLSWKIDFGGRHFETVLAARPYLWRYSVQHKISGKEKNVQLTYILTFWPPYVDCWWDKGHFIFGVHGNGMGYLTTLRTLKKLIFLSGHFLILCSIQSTFGCILNDFEYILI